MNHFHGTAPLAATRRPLAERRRPGRPLSVAPFLVPLLRFNPAVDAQAGTFEAGAFEAGQGPPTGPRSRDDLCAVRGLLAAVLLAPAIWVVIGVPLWWVLRVTG